MALRPVVGSALSCGGCRTSLLRSFIAASGIQIPAIREPVQWPRSPRPVQPRAPFSSRSSLRSEEQTHEQNDNWSKLDAASRPNEAPSQPQDQDTPKCNTDATPWYLQVSSPLPEPTPLSERQRLPDLPSHPPTLLQPLLSHISTDLGLDDLTLLDLRGLDPPPALGSTTLMILGTARSEKHLHVSADRLCRWLRSTHNLRPYADGLLGRNELKLKIRRKAKRSKLLSAVGTKTTDSSADLDDGIRTGWVCVNIDKVEGGELPAQKEERERVVQGFVGFGNRTPGCRIVVQMMTEEKRGQIDLEALWGGILRRAAKAKEEVEAALEEENRAATQSERTGGSAEAFDGGRYSPMDIFIEDKGRKQDSPNV
ncbi:hypothetical protein MBLNU457_1191t1 [Dothideomycetes sp. NU457]